MPDNAIIQVWKDHAIPVGEIGENVVVTVKDGDTVYYGDRQVTASSNLGSLTVGQSVTLSSPGSWLISASISEVLLSATVIPDPGGAVTKPAVIATGLQATDISGDAAGAAAAAQAAAQSASIPISQKGAASGVADLTSAGAVPDSRVPLYNLANSGAVGTATSDTTKDHTALIQTYVNAVAATAAAKSSLNMAIIDCPPLCYRVQNLILPGNVALRLNGTRITYVHQSLNPPSGPGNYVIVMQGAYNALKGHGSVDGNGSAQPWIGGVWMQSAGQAGVGSARAFQCHVSDHLIFSQFGGRAIFDQGVGNHIENAYTQNSLLSATAIDHHMGVVEQAGTDGWVKECEINPSVNAISGGIAVPRCPVAYDRAAITTTNGSITLPLSAAVITLTSTASAIATGGLLLIGGHQITYTGVSGSTLTGCNCADSGTISTATSVFQADGFVVAFHKGGGTNWSRDNVAEFGDVSLYLGPNVLAHTTASAALTTSGVGTQPVQVDNAMHFGNVGVNGTAGGVVAVWSGSGASITFNQFTYGSISETTLAASAALSTSSSTVQVTSTTGWPASGTFHTANGWTVTYTSIVDGTHIGGCTVAAGAPTIASGTYIRADTLNACFVAASTLAVGSAKAILNIGQPGLRVRMSHDRADFARCHGVVIEGASGSVFGTMALFGGQSSSTVYDGWHVTSITGNSSAIDAYTPTADSSSQTNRFRYAILDQQSSGTPNRWIKPRRFNCSAAYFGNSSLGPLFDFGPTATVLCPTNSTAPVVTDGTAFVLASTGSVTVTSFPGGMNGMEITVLQDINTTIANNASIVTLSGANITPPGSGYKALKFKFIGYGAAPTPAWYQL